MKNQKLTSRLVLFSVIGGLTLSSFVGSQNEIVSALATTQTASTVKAVTNTNAKKKITYLDYDRFVCLKDAKLACTFENTASKNGRNKPFSIKGSYDLNKDGKKDSIKFSIGTNKDDLNVTLKINGKKRKDYINAPKAAYIVDLDKDDSFLDLVLYDEGMYNEPTYHFYRYNGKSIKYLSAFCTLKKGTIAFDGHNHVVAKDSFLGYLNPPMLRGYSTLTKNLWKYHKFDLSGAENKAYKLKKSTPDGSFGAYFIETNKKPDEVKCNFTGKYQIKLRKGDKITIRKIDRNERYQVKLKDGRVGVLYFWNGD